MGRQTLSNTIALANYRLVWTDVFFPNANKSDFEIHIAFRFREVIKLSRGDEKCITLKEGLKYGIVAGFIVAVQYMVPHTVPVP